MRYMKLIFVGIGGIFLSILFFAGFMYMSKENSDVCFYNTIIWITFGDITKYNEKEIREKITSNLKAEIMQDVWTWSDFDSQTLYLGPLRDNQTIQIIFPAELPENTAEFSVIKNTLLSIEYLTEISEPNVQLICPHN